MEIAFTGGVYSFGFQLSNISRSGYYRDKVPREEFFTMNDFLQALRTNRPERQRSAMTRKNYDETYNTRIPEPVDEPSASRFKSAVEDLNGRLGGYAGNRKYFIDAQERIADSLERQVIAFERILARLNIR